MITKIRRPLVALLAGGSVGGFLAVHAIHVVAVAGAPTAMQFLCSIGR
jgi:hypothetical protein